MNHPTFRCDSPLPNVVGGSSIKKKEKQKKKNAVVVDISRSSVLKKADSDATENKGGNKEIEDMEVSSAFSPHVRATAKSRDAATQSDACVLQCVSVVADDHQVDDKSAVAGGSSVKKEFQNKTKTTLPVPDLKPSEVDPEAEESTASIYIVDGIFKKPNSLPSTTPSTILDRRVKRSNMHDSRNDFDDDDDDVEDNDDVNAVLDAKELPRKKLCIDDLDEQRGSRAATELFVDGEGEKLKENSNERSNETSNSVENMKSVGIGEWGMNSFDTILSSEFAVSKDTVIKLMLINEYKLPDFKRVIMTLTSGTNEIVIFRPSWVFKHCLETIKSCFGRKRIRTSAKPMGQTGPEVEVIDDDLYATPYSGEHVLLRQKSRDSRPDGTLCISGATWVNILQKLPVFKSVVRDYENMLISKHPFLEYYAESPVSDYGFE